MQQDMTLTQSRIAQLKSKGLLDFEDRIYLSSLEEDVVRCTPTPAAKRNKLAGRVFQDCCARLQQSQDFHGHDDSGAPSFTIDLMKVEGAPFADDVMKLVIGKFERLGFRRLRHSHVISECHHYDYLMASAPQDFAQRLLRPIPISRRH